MLRRMLDTSLETQRSWRSSEKALKAWKLTVERSGVLVFEMSRVPVTEVRGVAIHFDRLPVIVLNGADEAAARTFSLFHELAHIGLGVSAIDDSSDANSGLNAHERQIETFCNAVAAEMLVPADALIALIAVETDVGIADTLVAAAKAFSVSRLVIARRLLTLDRIDGKQYSALQEQLFTPHVALIHQRTFRLFGRILMRSLSREA